MIYLDLIFCYKSGNALWADFTMVLEIYKCCYWPMSLTIPIFLIFHLVQKQATASGTSTRNFLIGKPKQNNTLKRQHFGGSLVWLLLSSSYF